MPNDTTAQKLQRCRDQLSQLQSETDRNEGLLEELTTTREQLARAELQLQQDTSVSANERRRWTEQLSEAVTARDAWTKRCVTAENKLREYEAVVRELRSFLEGKECVLPRIKQIIGSVT